MSHTLEETYRPRVLCPPDNFRETEVISRTPNVRTRTSLVKQPVLTSPVLQKGRATGGVTRPPKHFLEGAWSGSRYPSVLTTSHSLRQTTS